MAQRRARMLAVATAAAVALTVVGTQSGAEAGGRGGGHGSPGADRPTKVVIIVVDSLSKEIVDKYRMRNIQKLMKDGVDTPNGYLGHTGSVTVGHPQRDHVGPAAQAHGLDRRGLPRRRRRAGRPRADESRPALHHQQRHDRPLQAPAGRGLPQARRLPRCRRPDRQDLHDQPQGLCRLCVRWRRLRLDHHVRQRSGVHDRRHVAQADRHQRAVVHPGGAVQPLLGAQRLPDLRLRHRQAAGDPLPARQRPLRHRQGPGARRWRRVGGRRRRRGDAQRGQLERHLRHAPRRRQGRTHVGWDVGPRPDRHRRRPDDAHGGRDRGGRPPGRQADGRARGPGGAGRHPRRAHRRPRLGRGKDVPGQGGLRARLRLQQLVLRRSGERRGLQQAAGRAAAARRHRATSGLSYSDSMLRVWLKDQSPAKVDEAAAAMRTHGERDRGVEAARRPLRPGLTRALGRVS